MTKQLIEAGCQGVVGVPGHLYLVVVGSFFFVLFPLRLSSLVMGSLMCACDEPLMRSPDLIKQVTNHKDGA